jgi:release factor glutamine methyltransferase
MTYNELWRQLAQIYDEGEAKAIARMTYEECFGLTLSDIYLGKDTQLSADCQTELEEIAKRLMQGEPVQYVLGRADFCGRTFMVNKHVLIPRPETEELCQWIIAADAAQILDIGTGSGCIAITLAAEMPEAEVTAWDISAEALSVARENAKRTHVHVSFEQVDILHLPSSVIHLTSAFDLIVSNPPYICNKERAAMEANVLEHEPHTALFVPDDDPLLFYRAIAQYASTALKPGGWLYFEINPLYAEPLRDMLNMMLYHDIEIKEDQYGKQRMIRAKKR